MEDFLDDIIDVENAVHSGEMNVISALSYLALYGVPEETAKSMVSLALEA